MSYIHCFHFDVASVFLLIKKKIIRKNVGKSDVRHHILIGSLYTFLKTGSLSNHNRNHIDQDSGMYEILSSNN